MVKLLKTYEYGLTPNSYDFLKLVALLAMFIDHAGYYLFLEAEWLRVIGRVSFPTFLFLVGYSRSTRFDVPLLVGAALVFISGGFASTPIIPLNILFTIVVVRLILAVLDRFPSLWKDLTGLWVAMTIFYLPTALLFEYGSTALMFACLGRFTREGRNGELGIRVVWLYTLFFHLIAQQITFEFPLVLCVIMIILTIVMGIGLMQFRLTPLRFPENNVSPVPNLREKITVLAGRNTLLLYVLHVIALQWWGSKLHPEIFTHGFAGLMKVF